MPEKATLQRAAKDKREGKAASTQAGEFIREEMHHVREGKHGARSTKQVIAIGLSKARRAGVKLRAPKKGQASKATRRHAARDLQVGARGRRSVSRRRARATSRVLEREGRQAASKRAVSRHAESAAARRRRLANRTANARKAARMRARSR